MIIASAYKLLRYASVSNAFLWEIFPRAEWAMHSYRQSRWTRRSKTTCLRCLRHSGTTTAEMPGLGVVMVPLMVVLRLSFPVLFSRVSWHHCDGKDCMAFLDFTEGSEWCREWWKRCTTLMEGDRMNSCVSPMSFPQSKGKASHILMGRGCFQHTQSQLELP